MSVVYVSSPSKSEHTKRDKLLYEHRAMLDAYKAEYAKLEVARQPTADLTKAITHEQAQINAILGVPR